MKLKDSQKWMLVLSHAMADAWGYEQFRKDLVTDPKEALWDRYQYQWPSHITIEFEERNISGNYNYSDVDFSAFDNPHLQTTYKLLLYIPNDLEDFADKFTLSNKSSDDVPCQVQCMC